jgi:hypothetical protein
MKTDSASQAPVTQATTVPGAVIEVDADGSGLSGIVDGVSVTDGVGAMQFVLRHAASSELNYEQTAASSAIIDLRKNYAAQKFPNARCAPSRRGAARRLVSVIAYDAESFYSQATTLSRVHHMLFFVFSDAAKHRLGNRDVGAAFEAVRATNGVGPVVHVLEK